MTAPRQQALHLVLAALLISLFLSALDSTIIATALPTIVGDLGGLDHIAWVFTAYLLCSTITVPLFGKISDIYGRRPIYQLTIVIFLVTSILAGMSTSMGALILFRGLQGIGGGGLLAMTYTILGDILAPRDRAQYTGYFSGVYAAAAVVGPLIGGFFVDNFSWRWVFYINVPICFVAMAIVAKYLNLPDPTERRPIDLLGSLLFAVAVTVLLLAVTWGGHEYAWGSRPIVGLLGAAILFSALFLLQERRAADPLIPLWLFKNDIFAVANLIGVLFGSVSVIASVFLPLFLQIVNGASATSSGLLLVPMMGGTVVGAMYRGRLITRTGRYKIFPIIGAAEGAVGIAMLATIGVNTSGSFVSFAMLLLGIGLGTSAPVMTLVVQNVVTRRDMGAATSAVNFFRSLGSAFGVAAFGAIQSGRLHEVLAARLPNDAAVGDRVLHSPKLVLAMPAPIVHAIQEAVAVSIALAFRWALPVIVLTFVVSLMLREVALRQDVKVASPVEGMEEALSMLEPAAPGLEEV